MMKRMIAIAFALGLAAAGSAALAQEKGAPDSGTAPPMMDRQGSGMMGGMMGGMDHAQMQRMMDNCNRMMESRMQPAPEKKS